MRTAEFINNEIATLLVHCAPREVYDSFCARFYAEPVVYPLPETVRSIQGCREECFGGDAIHLLACDLIDWHDPEAKSEYLDEIWKFALYADSLGNAMELAA